MTKGHIAYIKQLQTELDPEFLSMLELKYNGVWFKKDVYHFQSKIQT